MLSAIYNSEKAYFHKVFSYKIRKNTPMKPILVTNHMFFPTLHVDRTFENLQEPSKLINFVDQILAIY